MNTNNFNLINFFKQLWHKETSEEDAEQALEIGELKTDYAPIRNIGLVIVFSTVGFFGIWSITAPIDSSALAPGVIAVKSHKKSIQHLDGGIVKKLLVKAGDLVNAGDVLIKLDDTQINAQLEISKGLYISLLAQQSRLVAERDLAKKITYPKALSTDSVRVTKAKQIQQQIFLTRKGSYQGETSVLKQRVEQLHFKIEGLEQQQLSSQSLVASYQEEIDDLKELLSDGFADRSRLRDIQRSHTLKIGEIAELTADIASTNIKIGETKLQILQIAKEFQEGIAAQLGETNAKLIDAEERVTALSDKVVRTEIRAPVGGRAMGMMIHTEGGVILPGRPILDIVPQNEELIVDARVSPMDIDRVHVGLVAQVRLSAFKQALTPVVEGKLITLSADRLMDEQTGMPYFSAQVELTPESLVKLEDFELLPGMPAEVLINTGERTVFEYLTQPVSNAFARGFIED
ncbi:MAG: membrane fusion protein, epimerase transport system (plasmid) [Methyloprofundus sp.]|nr:MAG: membrane fusion protein, epimerase transport system [Methyloprofundus sp.]